MRGERLGWGGAIVASQAHIVIPAIEIFLGEQAASAQHGGGKAGNGNLDHQRVPENSGKGRDSMRKRKICCRLRAMREDCWPLCRQGWRRGKGRLSLRGKLRSFPR